MERILHRESPSVRRLSHPANGNQTTKVSIRTPPLMAQDLVAGLEGPSSEDLLFRCQGEYACLN
jgi:hypothetical protein